MSPKTKPQTITVKLPDAPDAFAAWMEIANARISITYGIGRYDVSVTSAVLHSYSDAKGSTASRGPSRVPGPTCGTRSARPSRSRVTCGWACEAPRHDEGPAGLPGAPARGLLQRRAGLCAITMGWLGNGQRLEGGVLPDGRTYAWVIVP